MEDDPLRALRAVRFGARFRFEVAEDLAESLRSKDTHAVLASKVRREKACIDLGVVLNKKTSPLTSTPKILKPKP